MKMKIQLSDHFTYSKLLRYTLPSIVMMVFTSIYGVVDGFFVSNWVGKTPFTAVNLIYPVLMILGCAGFMYGTGGGAHQVGGLAGDQPAVGKLYGGGGGTGLLGHRQGGIDMPR